MKKSSQPKPLTREDLLDVLELTTHSQLRALRLLRGSKRGRPKGPAKPTSNIDVVIAILQKENGHILRVSLVSALTKKVLDQHTFTRTAPNTFALLHRP